MKTKNKFSSYKFGTNTDLFCSAGWSLNSEWNRTKFYMLAREVIFYAAVGSTSLAKMQNADITQIFSSKIFHFSWIVWMLDSENETWKVCEQKECNCHWVRRLKMCIMYICMRTPSRTVALKLPFPTNFLRFNFFLHNSHTLLNSSVKLRKRKNITSN